MKRRTSYLWPLALVPAIATGLFACSERSRDAASEAPAAAPASTTAADGDKPRYSDEPSGEAEKKAPAQSPALKFRSAAPERAARPSPAPPSPELHAAPHAPRPGHAPFEFDEPDSSIRPHRLPVVPPRKAAASSSPSRFGIRGPGESSPTDAKGGEGRADFWKQEGQREESGILAPRAGADMMFKHYGVNPTIDTAEQRHSTFAVDVDTASYTMARAFLERGQLPVEAAVRVEEVVNAFDYAYEPPLEEAFGIHAEAAPSPNRRGYHVLHVGIKGKQVSKADRKRANLVFVIDVSGSMEGANRLGLVKQSLHLLVDQLGEADKVGIVTYGSEARALLEPTSAHDRRRIRAVIDGLKTDGATNAEAGIRMGYRMAERHLGEGAVNRVVLLSDGVANVGLTGPTGLLQMVEQETRRGITISTVGFGMGNYNDVLMEKLADGGDGNYYYVDKLDEARRVFVDSLTGTLQVIAKDAKIQLELDPKVVARYRLLGYENRALASHQFDDDRVDAGELGAGHSVTAIYEVKLHEGATGSLGTVRVRFKAPSGGASRVVEAALSRDIVRDSAAALSSPTQLSLVAAQFAEKLRGSYWARNVTYEDILGRFSLVKAPLRDRADVRELERLVKRASEIDKRGDKFADHGPVAMMDFDRVPVLR